MGDALDRIGEQVALFTTDSDAPKSSRVAYMARADTDAGERRARLC